MTPDAPVTARALLPLEAQLKEERARADRAEAEVRDWRRHHFEKRITTRCPTYGHQTLFIAVGGHLTCSWLKCPEPGVGRAIAEERRHGALVADERGGADD
jgi:hypothetical protein